MNNITDIKRTLLILKNHGVNKINIRCIGKSTTKNEIFSTTEADEILEYIKRLEKNYNIYTTFNCFDTVKKNTVEKNTVSNKDIKKIKFILLDIDPERPSGTASTDEQKKGASEVFKKCLNFLSENEIIHHYAFDSGNGYHALIPVNIEPSKENQTTIKKFLYLLDSMFSTKTAHVDKGVHDPARITRLYGTLNIKGIDINSEKCRYSRFLEDKAKSKENDFNLIKKIVTNYGEKENDYSLETKRTPYLLVTDPIKWFKEHNLKFIRDETFGGSGELYKFESCPMRKHRNNDKGHYFIVDRNRCYFACHHASCEHQNINTFNEKYPCPESLLLKDESYSSDSPTIDRLLNGEKFKFGKYILNKNGVVRLTKDGEEMISSNPIYVKEAVFNVDTEIFYYNVEVIGIGNKIINFPLNGKELNPRVLGNILAERGVFVTSEYKIHPYISQQIHNTPIKHIHNKVGWVEYESLSYNLMNSFGAIEKSTLNANSSFKLANSGSYDEILSLVNDDVLGTNMEIALAIGFTPIVLGYLAKNKLPDIGSLMINLMGRSSTGKTTALHFIQSIYGHPISNMLTFNTTANALLAELQDNYGVATVIDELSSSDIFDMSQLVYQIANGKTKGRLSSRSKPLPKFLFNTTVICSSEISFDTRLNDNPGLKVRLIEIDLDEPWTKNAESSERIKRLANINYGILSEKFIENLFSQEQKHELIKEHFQSSKDKLTNVLPDSEYKSRVANNYAIILASATLVKDLLNIELDIEKITNLLIELENKAIQNRKGIPYNIKEKITEFIHRNNNRFYYDKANIRSSGKIGLIKSDSSKVYADIFVGVFEKFLRQELNVEDTKLVIKRLIDENIILTNDKQRNNTRPYIAGSRENCYRVKIAEEDYQLIINNLAPSDNTLLDSSTVRSNLINPLPNESVDDIEL